MKRQIDYTASSAALKGVDENNIIITDNVTAQISYQTNIHNIKGIDVNQYSPQSSPVLI